MSKKNNDKFNIDNLLKNLYNESLTEIFDRRLLELGISPTNACDLLGIEYRSLKGILTGTQKRVDFTNLVKIANFLQLPKEDIVRLFINALEDNFEIETASSADKVEFIKSNFDLGVLKQAGFIDNITDFDLIEKKIVTFLGLNTIFDYQLPPREAAFSAGVVQPKNDINRGLWINAAKRAFRELDNPYPYDKDALLKYFPEIRWHCANVKYGLTTIIKELYRLGVTVIYQTTLPSIHLRGATVNINNKPCIVLTDYRGYYPTLWFALIHELFHVIFDWDEIKNSIYHISDNDKNRLSVIEKEEEANNFAREYLFSKEKTKAVRPHLNDTAYVYEFAKNNHIHPSMIYVFNAYDVGQTDRMAWARANRHNPDFKELIAPFENPWDKTIPIKQFIKLRKHTLYN